MKKILFAVIMLSAIPIFAGVSSTFPYGLKASTITATGQSTLSSTTVNGILSVSSTTAIQTAVLYSTMNVYGALRFEDYPITHPSDFKIDMETAYHALKIGNMRWGSAWGNSAWANVTGAKIDLGNSATESQTFTTINNITNATAGQLFVSRLASSNTTADYIRLDGATDTKIWGVNRAGNMYAKYGITASSITLNGVTISSWTSGGDVYQAGNNTMSGTNNFTGIVQRNGNTAFIPYYVVASTDWVTMSSATYTINFSTGVYEYEIRGAMSGSGNMNFQFDGAASNLYNTNFTFAQGGGSAIGGDGPYNYGRFCMGDSTYMWCHGNIRVGYMGSITAYDFRGGTSANGNEHIHGGHWSGGGFPTTISIYSDSASTFTGRIWIKRTGD